jgi:glycosyltransferase 2 family protein
VNETEIIPEVTAKSPSKTVRLLKLFLKIAVTGLCLWYVSTKINLTELEQAINSVNVSALAGVLVVFLISKIFAVRRFDIYLRAINIRLTQWENIKLFWLGMFYNLFLPGSITGDAYKVILLRKTFDTSYKKTMAAVLLDRFSGLLALGVLLAVYGLFVLENNNYIISLLIASTVAIIISYFISRRFFPDFSAIFWSTFFWGLLVQLLMVLCIEMIVRAMGIETNPAQYVFIFLIAAVAGVLPFAIGGGLGIRELVFLEGAKYIGLDQPVAVAVSLLFYLISLVASLPGIIFVFKNPLQRNK